jgi:hypothetical protein
VKSAIQEKISPESLHQLRWSPSLFKRGLFQNKKNLFCICAYTDVKQVLRKKWESALMEQAEST